jgi:hypothetical protein
MAMIMPKGTLKNAGLTFGFVLALLIPAFVLTGGGHGTGLFVAVALSPGSLFGDNALALSGILFWLLFGAMLARPIGPRRRLAAVLFLLLHYAVVLYWALQQGSDGYQGLSRMTVAASPYLAVFAFIYLAGHFAFWRRILKPR